jgi:hypothetical protein
MQIPSMISDAPGFVSETFGLSFSMFRRAIISLIRLVGKSFKSKLSKVQRFFEFTNSHS